MAVKRKGIVARPGVHHNVRTGQDEVVTWEELKKAVQFQNRVPLVIGHPAMGYIRPQDRIGTVTQVVNEKDKTIEGEFWFFDEPECWDQIPPEVKRKIIGGDEISLSAGYRVGQVVGGVQTSRQYDHIALDVKDPLHKDVGITQGDVRMEAEFPDDFRIEETPSIEGEKKEPQAAPAAQPVQDKEFWIDYGRKMARLELLEQQAQQQAVVPEKPVVEENTEEPGPEQEDITVPAPPKPRTVVPRGTSKKEGPDEDGLFKIST
jgi:hypothetical protein